MNVRINQGYVITDSIHIGKAEFVIGEMSNTPAPFVTWECKDGNNYFWGHYLTTRKAAERDLLERAVQELEYQTRRQAEMEPQDSPWGEIQTRETLCPGAYSVSTARSRPRPAVSATCAVILALAKSFSPHGLSIVESTRPTSSRRSLMKWSTACGRKTGCFSAGTA